ncbi:hypothetical protein T06_4394 [Trichinella sp. T6]|nr:hypothetical protein T06_4394 [Trichinella sp. T6]
MIKMLPVIIIYEEKGKSEKWYIHPLNMPAAVQVAENYATFEYIRELVAQKSNCLCARTSEIGAQSIPLVYPKQVIMIARFQSNPANVDKQAVQLYAGRSARTCIVSLIFCICESSISKIINRIVSLNQ